MRTLRSPAPGIKTQWVMGCESSWGVWLGDELKPQGGGICRDSELESSDSCGQWVGSGQPHSVTQLGGVGVEEQLHFCALWRLGRLGQRQAVRERESKPGEPPRTRTGLPWCDALWVIEPGVYEDKFMLHLRHVEGDGFLRLRLDANSFQQTTEIDATSQGIAEIRQAEDATVVCRQ